jgi:hypothetical protein
MPTPLKVVLGLAASAAEEARRLPDTLPAALTNVPVMAVSVAMQASLKVQQRLADLAARGDEVLAQLRGTSEEAPAWATFDDPPIGEDSSTVRAAFDRIDYDSTGFAEGGGESGRWDAVGAGDSDAVLDNAIAAAAAVSDELTSPAPPAKTARTRGRSATGAAGTNKATGRTAQASAAKASPAKASPAKATPAKATPAKASAAKASSPAKATRAKSSPTKSSPAKAARAKSSPAKSSPAKSTPASTTLSDDLAQAAREFSTE